ncbi:hypothetical protein HCN44_009534 [Aphidius gifuensis]|uniref:Uncharacterized protein n=1 Tax=Aphidius gifuensis TaxID=684658 RepID=A0A834Y4V7_APHGI|nr:hypothetical protein HCN44_009534 [Aphidius gifuensis]
MWQYVLLSLIIILYHPSTNRPVSIIDYPEDRFDFVIVGAGMELALLQSRLQTLVRETSPSKTQLLPQISPKKIKTNLI